MPFREALKEWIPPAVLSRVRRMRQAGQPVPFEYCPEGWARRSDPRVKGWDEESVAETQKRLWPGFLHAVQGTGPLGVNHTDFVPDRLNLLAHNNIMSFAYALALAAHGKDRVSLLDWGGGVGHYGVFSQALLPGIRVDYFCKEVPALCAAGREVFPEATFFENDEACFARKYDLVLCSGAIQYAEQWRETVRLLASATGGYFYLARVPIVHHVPAFVVVQRPYAAGYETEYVGWFFNREELLECARAAGLVLVRELLMSDRHEIKDAPEQGEYRAFLFRPV